MSKTDRCQAGAASPNPALRARMGSRVSVSHLLALASLIVLMSLAGFPLTASAVASTLWSDAAVPAVVDFGDPNPSALGVRFQSDVAGYITGIRLYDAPTN